MNIQETDLLENEKVILSKKSNLLIHPKHFGIKNFAFDDFMWTVGMKNKEALGGKLHLTNYRIIFKSHAVNRIRGKMSIFLPSIKEIKDTSFAVVKQVSVETQTSRVDFVLWGIEEFIKIFNEQKDQLDTEDIDYIQKQIIEHPEKSSDGLKTWNSLNTLNNLLAIGRKGADVAKLITNPIGALGSIFMKEIVDQSIAEEWQKNFK